MRVSRKNGQPREHGGCHPGPHFRSESHNPQVLGSPAQVLPALGARTEGTGEFCPRCINEKPRPFEPRRFLFGLMPCWSTVRVSGASIPPDHRPPGSCPPCSPPILRLRKAWTGVFGHHGCQRGNRRAGRYCGINPYPQVFARQQRHTFLEVGWSGLAELNEGRTSPPVESRQNQVRLAVSLPPRSLASARKWNRRGAEASPAPWVLDCERVKSVCAVQP